MYEIQLGGKTIARYEGDLEYLNYQRLVWEAQKTGIDIVIYDEDDAGLPPVLVIGPGYKLGGEDD